MTFFCIRIFPFHVTYFEHILTSQQQKSHDDSASEFADENQNTVKQKGNPINRDEN